MADRKCVTCGHDPACGHASIYMNGVERWYCHDNDHSCYAFSPDPDELDAVMARLFPAHSEGGQGG